MLSYFEVEVMVKKYAASLLLESEFKSNLDYINYLPEVCILVYPRKYSFSSGYL